METLAPQQQQQPTAANTERELPLFRNHLLHSSTSPSPSARTVTILAENKRKLRVQRIDLPTVYGTQPVLRRLDNDRVNATQLFRAAFPTSSEELEAREMQWLKGEGTGEEEISGKMKGIWVSLPMAQALAKEYGIERAVRNLVYDKKEEVKEDSQAKVEENASVQEVEKVDAEAEKVEKIEEKGDDDMERSGVEVKPDEPLTGNVDKAEAQADVNAVEATEDSTGETEAKPDLSLEKNMDTQEDKDEETKEETTTAVSEETSRKRKLDDVLREEVEAEKSGEFEELQQRAVSQRRKVRWMVGAAVAIAATAASAALPYFL
ncbi:uncharacterized protein VTP21DRAFT_9663 [Calcarisporiella thermophila]|uniref:uncharacterized protein n=1 Tax=Calcarisporiella thermophila TaxID=911321 RepID=UPI0037421CCF